MTMRTRFLNKWSALSLLLMPILVACTSSEQDEQAESGDVTFVVSGISTRASDTQFDTGDAIGVWASMEENGLLHLADNYADNVKYVYSSNRFINAGVGIPQAGNVGHTVSYYAAYPFEDNRSTRFTFQIHEDQSTYEGYTKSDLLMAYNAVDSKEAVVPLKFNHMLSRVLIDASELGMHPSNYRIELLSYRSSVTADMQQQVVETGESDYLKIKMCEDGTNHYKAIVPPQTLSVSNVTALLYIGLQQPISVTLRQDIQLTSGTSVELKLRKSAHGYYIDYGGRGNSSIPDDSEATPAPDVPDPNTEIPNIQYVPEYVDGDLIIRINMTGIRNPNTGGWMHLYGTRNPDQNIWVEVDDKPKGFTIYNNDDGEGEHIKTDVVFVVDNSGSMSEEANAVARDILSWAQELTASGLDVQFACVGYSVSGTINGALDFVNASGLSSYLNRSTGTSRTIGFSGMNASRLQTAASAYRVSDECGAMALLYANANLSFRSGASRIYVNFTDEPNQPNGRQQYSVEFFKDQNNWSTSQGTVHTVYSDTDTNWTEQLYYREYPWKISDYTGGTKYFTGPSFSNVNLSSLPVTGALQNSYVIRIHNVGNLMDGRTHVIKITIYTPDGQVRAVRTFYVTFTMP